MGSIDIIKPLSAVLSGAINKSQQHQGKNFQECREYNLGLLSELQVLFATQLFIANSAILPPTGWSNCQSKLMQIELKS